MNSTKILFASICIAVSIAATTQSCSRLSERAKEIAGIYYIPEISDDDPLMELYDDGGCVMRAIRPGVLTYSVEGQWNVVGDSLIVNLDTSRIKCNGDRSLIGHIAPRIAKKVENFTGNTLTLSTDGTDYVYDRRRK